MGEQSRLFRLGLEAVTVHASWSWPGGWQLRIGGRRQGESWDDAPIRDYSHLATDELVDVIHCELERLLER